MKTVVLGQPPAELEAFLDRRRALGQDLFDEIWEGAYHVAPASHHWHGYLDNVLAELLGPRPGRPASSAPVRSTSAQVDDHRVPDRGYHRGLPASVWVPTAAIVVEVVSPDDETWARFAFYASHGVDEICTADPVAGALRWFARAGSAYGRTEASSLLGVTRADLARQIDWPREPGPPSA